mmetsp:Transcript_5342/g.8418  ORF Transcript_5342/g.8418 Transcript_5342/m.8418 type:complete len:177 (+) Transcript_5342:102-632(+)|eukprot:jgi/Bigna1/91622/estExt_fgenesh1_pg.C_1090037
MSLTGEGKMQNASSGGLSEGKSDNQKSSAEAQNEAEQQLKIALKSKNRQELATAIYHAEEAGIPAKETMWGLNRMASAKKLLESIKAHDEAHEESYSSTKKKGGKTQWVKDNHANGCMVHGCNVRFSIFVRRHHCRHCGKVVCNTHSQGRVQVQGYKKPQRICDNCYETIPRTPNY